MKIHCFTRLPASPHYLLYGLFLLKLVIGLLLLLASSQASSAQSPHPVIYAVEADKGLIQKKIRQNSWARISYQRLLAEIDTDVDRHRQDPQWIISRLAMYWKKGEHYTQCYLKQQIWDYGTGDAPVPTVRLPGMRVWNEYNNVPLKDRLPYNESGDMKGTSSIHPEAGVISVPYRQSGHMVRANNNEILTLAEKAAFVYWLTGTEKYARFAADIFYTWLTGTYYMDPILDPGKSSGGPGGYAPGGILGYYDYEQIHDDQSTHAAVIYDFLYTYLEKHQPQTMTETRKDLKQVAGIVFKRFIDIGLVRGGKNGNWNVNGWDVIMPGILVLEPNEFYPDGHGKNYYLQFYTTTSTRYHNALPDILKEYDPVTGLWPESPGYASGTISSVIKIGLMLYKSGINTLAGNDMMQKAALAIFPWLDARGNLVNFGDGRGGAGDFVRFEHLLTYCQWANDRKDEQIILAALKKGVANKAYSRAKADWKGLCFNLPELAPTTEASPYDRAAYSPVHRHLVMKNGDEEHTALMFTLYGGYPKQKHLSPNGLAMQLYGNGWALAPDASGYESYWSADYKYHQYATGSNTIIPGYSSGPIQINASSPVLDSVHFTSNKVISPECSFADVTAGEKRRLVAMIRTSPYSGYYIDIFHSNQPDNDYIYHNLGNSLNINAVSGKALLQLAQDSLSKPYLPGYQFFKNIRRSLLTGDILATWNIDAVTPKLQMDMWLSYEPGRELYQADAPYTNLNKSVSPGGSSIVPNPTPTIIVRQERKSGWEHPFMAVFEPHNYGKKTISKISALKTGAILNAVLIENQLLESRQYVMHALDNQVHEVTGSVYFSGDFGVISRHKQHLQYLFLGHGKLLGSGVYQISALQNTSAEVSLNNWGLEYSAEEAIELTLPDKFSGGMIRKLSCKNNGQLIPVPLVHDRLKHTVSAVLPAGYRMALLFN